MISKHQLMLRRTCLLVSTIAMGVILLVLVQRTLAVSQLGNLTRLTSASGPNRDSLYASLSGDGRVVAFQSDSDFLNEGRPADVDEIWLYDTATMTYTRVTSASDASRASHRPSLSDEGTIVAFHSDSDFLDEGIVDGQWEIWLYDTATMTYTRVTWASGSGRSSSSPSLNGDGTVVAFHSRSDLLSEGRPENVFEIWLYDTATLTYTRVTSASDVERDSIYPSLSSAGTVIAFYSDSDFLNEGRPDGVDEIWLYDLGTMTYTRVTSASDGLRDSWSASLSGDGEVVAFKSDSDFLHEGIVDDQWEIWLYDTATMTYTRVTWASDADRDSQAPSLDGDGSVVAFLSDSDLLNEGRPDGLDEIWLYDSAALTLTRVTSATGFGYRRSWMPSLNEDGTVMAFESDSDFLHEGRMPMVYEIWLWEMYRIYLPLVLRSL